MTDCFCGCYDKYCCAMKALVLDIAKVSFTFFDILLDGVIRVSRASRHMI